MTTPPTGRLMMLEVTPETKATVQRVAAAGRDQLVMVLGTGCCDSSAPYLYDRYYPGSDVVRIGATAKVPVYAHEWFARLYQDDRLQLDVDQDVPNDSFSLESEFDCRFTLKILEPTNRR